MNEKQIETKAFIKTLNKDFKTKHNFVYSTAHVNNYILRAISRD